MTFLYPEVLYGLLLCAIPIIIHFFNFRRYRVQEFTQVKFLEKAAKNTKRFKQLKDWLIMLSRILLIAFLIIAFAHPIPEGIEINKKEQNHVLVYLDNSFSMELKSEDGDLLSAAKSKIAEIVKGFPSESRFNLITNSGGTGSEFLEADPFLAEVDQTESTSLSLAQEELLQLQENVLQRMSGSKHAFWITDMQKNFLSLNSAEFDSTYQQYFIPMEAENVNNLSIDSLWFEQGVFEQGQAADLKMKVSNHGEADIKQRNINLEINGIKRGLKSVDLAAGAEEVFTLKVNINSRGWNRFEASIEDYPIEFDNVFYAALYIPEKINVLCINGTESNPFIQRIYKTNDVFQLTERLQGQVDVNSFNDYELIILNEVNDPSSGLSANILKSIEQGANLLVLPSAEAEDINALTTRFGLSLNKMQEKANSVKSLDLENSFFDDVFEKLPKNVNLPKVTKYYVLEKNIRSKATELMTLANGDAFFSQAKFGSGNCFLTAVPARKDFTNLPNHALFVPIMYKVATYSSQSQVIGHTIDAKPAKLHLSGQAAGSVFKLKLNGQEFIPEQSYKNGRLTLADADLKSAGIFKLEKEGLDSTLAYLGVNFSRKESEMQFYTEEEWRPVLEEKGVRIFSMNEELSSAVRDRNDKNTLWKLFLWAAMLFLILEIAFIKLLKS